MKQKLIHSSCVRKADRFIIESAASDVPDGCMRLTGTFAVVSTNENKVVNDNNRYYVMENYKSMVSIMNKEINEGDGVFGELEHPKTMNLDWDRVSHKIESISIDESTGVVSGSILVLGTPKGQIVQECFKAGMKPRISSRGRGVIHEDGKTVLSVMPTYDIVRKSGFAQATMNITESSTGVEEVVMESFEIDIVEDSTGVVNTNGEVLTLEAIKKIVKEEVKGAAKDLAATVKDEIEKDVKDIEVDENGQINLNAIQAYFENLISERISNSEERTQNYVQESMHKLGDAVQSWTVEQFAPEVQKWVVESYSPEVQKWVIESYSPQVQKWVVEEFAPEVQNWVVEAYSPEVQKWVVEEFAPTIATNATNVIQVSETKDDDKEDDKEKDATVDVEEKELTLLEKIDAELAKAEPIAKDEIEKSKKAKEDEEANEAKKTKMLSLMPRTVKHLFEALDKSDKDQIFEQSLIRDFKNDEAIIEFLESRFSSKSKTELATKIMSQQVVSEGFSNKLAAFSQMLY